MGGHGLELHVNYIYDDITLWPAVDNQRGNHSRSLHNSSWPKHWTNTFVRLSSPLKFITTIERERLNTPPEEVSKYHVINVTFHDWQCQIRDTRDKISNPKNHKTSLSFLLIVAELLDQWQRNYSTHYSQIILTSLTPQWWGEIFRKSSTQDISCQD